MVACSLHDQLGEGCFGCALGYQKERKQKAISLDMDKPGSVEALREVEKLEEEHFEQAGTAASQYSRTSILVHLEMELWSTTMIALSWAVGLIENVKNVGSIFRSSLQPSRARLDTKQRS